MELATATRAFSIFLLAERGLAAATEYAYRRDLMRLGDFLGWPNVEDITLLDLRSWLAEQHRHGLAPLSINRRIACLKSFFRWAEQCGYVELNPARNLSMPKKPRRLPQPLTFDEMTRFFRTPVRPYPSRAGFKLELRDRTAFDLMLLLGLRRGEVLNLQLSDVDLGQGVLYIRRAKGDQDRALPIPEQLSDRLHEYMLTLLPARSSYLVVSRSGNRLWPQRLHHIFRRHLRHCGIFRDGVSPHTLRHTMATMLAREGVQQSVLQRLLGHRDPASTAMYVHLDVTDLAPGLRKHPLLSNSNTIRSPKKTGR